MQKVFGLAFTDTLFPGGTTLGGYTVSATEASDPTFSQVVKAAAGATSVTFDLEPGTYTITGQTVDPAGTALGPPVVISFVLAAPEQVTISLLTGISPPA
jgi:hypothetical protein